MELLERQEYLKTLNSAFCEVRAGRGQNVFVAGEAGIGKTAVVRQFLADLDSPHLLLEGYCDSLFAARPLGPLFDVAPSLGDDFVQLLRDNPDRNLIFPAVLEALNDQSKPVILWIEDIHWADEATLDLIRYLARRIRQLQCLIILTIRDNEMQSTHPFRQLLGELNPDDFHKVSLAPLSRETVLALADAVGRNGEDVYHLTAGVPYYVREILSSYNLGIPETVRDSILSLYHRQFDSTRDLWETLSVIPGRIDMAILQKIYPTFSRVVEFCFTARILIHDGNAVSFKHELFRTTIEESLSPIRKRELHQIVADVLSATPEAEVPVARIIHHARLAGDTKLLRSLAPEAATEASKLGSHLEAAKFFKLALDHCQGMSQEQVADLYEKYAYECYLTNQIPLAIDTLEKALELWDDNNALRKGNSLRFLSRLNWFAGHIRRSEVLANRAIELCESYSESRELAMAYSNMSQLMMLKGETDSCLDWGMKAISLAKTLGDPEVLCHGYDNIGVALLRDPERSPEGEKMLRESLDLALEHRFHEHAARAYNNLGNGYLELLNYSEAEQNLVTGIQYCEERDLQSWVNYLRSSLALVFQKTGRYDEALKLVDQLLLNPNQQENILISLQAIRLTILMRTTGNVQLADVMSVLHKAWQIGELRRIGGAVTVLFEFEWLNDQAHPMDSFILGCVSKLMSAPNPLFAHELTFWMWKAKDRLPQENADTEEVSEEIRKAQALSALAQIQKGDPFLEALALAEGTPDEQREAVIGLRELGALSTLKHVESAMREKGVLQIPRGPHASTIKNSAGLTKRQMDVLKLLEQGLQNKEIAEKLFVSPKTVDHHISAILSKLDVHSRSKAVSMAREIGILK